MTDADRLIAYDAELSSEMPADMKDWWRNSRDEWPIVARLVLQHRRENLEECRTEVERLRLTDEERAAVSWCVEMALHSATDCVDEVRTLRGLLERL